MRFSELDFFQWFAFVLYMSSLTVSLVSRRTKDRGKRIERRLDAIYLMAFATAVLVLKASGGIG